MTHRRQILAAIAALPLTTLPFKCLSSDSDADSYSDRTIADDWISEWMPKTAAAGALHLLRFSDGYYAITKKIGWSPNKGQEDLNPVSVPRGFVTDFASIPRVFWSIFPKDGQYTYAAIIHDFLYWDQTIARESSDQIFKHAMQEFKVPSATIAAVHKAVRLGGQVAWDKNTKAKNAGERKVLRTLPDDPLISWEEWKRKPDVFE
jgi:hypothetical protein